MCGLVGIFDPPGRAPRAVLEPELSGLLESIRHRGPDGEGSFFEDGVALGHRRLAIVDLNETGAQPMSSRDARFTVVYNGEIYNHLELRRSLAREWRGTSDTETLLEAIARNGLERALGESCGMFAFALYDRSERCVHLIRDRFGIKPLFYAQRSKGGWVFGSEATALGRSLRSSIDREALKDYLSWGYPAPGRTLLEGVMEVAPGEIVTLSSHGLTRKRYYTLPLNTSSDESESQRVEAFDHAFRRSVREHQMSDVPIGILLSSGVDSSAVAVSAAGSSNLSAFTVRFADPGLDESADAERLAKSLGIPVVSLTVASELDRDTLDAVSAASDLPLADSSNVGTWLIAREASKHVKVLLTGDGADETWGGYDTYAATDLVGTWLGTGIRSAGVAMQALIGPAPPVPGRPGLRMRVARFAQHAGHEPLEAHRRWRTLIDPDSLNALGLTAPGAKGFEPALEAASGAAGLNAALALDVATYMVQDELVRLDRMGMAHGVEGRVPFLDHRLVELAFSWAPETKVRRGEGKRPVRRWLERSGFPRPARSRKKGFNHPVAAWMAGAAGDWLEDDLETLSGFLAPHAIKTWLREHRAGQRDRAYELFTVLTLARWMNKSRSD